MITVSRLKTSGLENPLGIATAKPCFSWIGTLSTNAPETVPQGYELEVSRDEAFRNVIWRKNDIAVIDQLELTYAGQPLESKSRYFWRVCAKGISNEKSAWSEIAWFETAALDASALDAEWITDSVDRPADTSVLYFSKNVNLPSAVIEARAYTSALGWYKLLINDTNVTGSALVPRWTPLDHVVEYQTYDVGRFCHIHENRITLVVADGRFRGRLGFMNRRNTYGDHLAVFCVLNLSLEDGSTINLSTDETWTVDVGTIKSSDPKAGEIVDFRLGQGDMNPVMAKVLPHHPRKLIGEEVNRVEEVDRIRPVKLWRSPRGKQLVDFGQNISGCVRLDLPARDDTRVALTFSEVIGRDGEIETDYLVPSGGGLVQRDEATLSSEPTTFQPWFTIHGFRYVEIDGLEEDVQSEHITAVVLSTNMPFSGSFSCSDSRLNRLYRNIQWSMRGNFTDTATDCPTRERSGWTGDIQIFSKTASILMDSNKFLARYMSNLALEQFPDGRIPAFIPSEMSETSPPSALFNDVVTSSVGWGDVAVIVPWTLYQYYGNRNILEQQFQSMELWVTLLERLACEKSGVSETDLARLVKAFSETFPTQADEFAAVAKQYKPPTNFDTCDDDKYILDSEFHWGEWLRPDDKVEGFLDIFDIALHPPAVVATAYLAYSAGLLAQISQILDKPDSFKRFSKLTGNVASAWRRKFVSDNGARIGDDKQDDYVRAIAFDLLLPEQKAGALDRLCELIQTADSHLGTGFLSTAMLLDVLADNGKSEAAYKILLQTSLPSWLYQVEKGATTSWETWHGYDDSGNASMSHNHYAFGVVASWLVEGVAGLKPLEPGYRKIKFCPVTGGGLTSASCEVDTPFGPARSAWERSESGFSLEIYIPLRATGEVQYKEQIVHDVPHGKHNFFWEV